MAYKSEIQWTNATVNFWTGCKKVSKGCKFCYMYRDKERYGQDPTTVLRVSDKTFYAATKWPDPKLIFTCSWSDFFIQEADEWRADAWKVIKDTPHHTWQILTKRPERILQFLPADWGEGYPNVWIGVSVEDMPAYEERVPILKTIPAKVKFLSVEPLIGQVTVLPTDNWIDWVIVGGESGNENGKYTYRKCNMEWISVVIYACIAWNIPIFVKQFGTYLAQKNGMRDRHGGNIDEFPDWAKFREMPKVYQYKN